MNGRGRADIHAPGRVRGHQQFRLLKYFPAKDEFLQVTAGQAAGRCQGAGCLDPEAANDVLRHCQDLGALNQPLAHQPVLECSEQGVVRQAQVRYGAMPQAFGRDEGQAALAAGIGR
ncbi:hypothetical protein D9M71_737000 [compost metagenome]